MLVGAPLWIAGMLRGVAQVLRPGRARRKTAQRRDWFKKWRAGLVAAAKGVPPRDTVEPLREALTSLRQTQVRDLLGPPTGATGEDSSAPVDGAIWYYPLHLDRHIAVAVRFEHGKVTAVEECPGPAKL